MIPTACRRNRATTTVKGISSVGEGGSEVGALDLLHTSLAISQGCRMYETDGLAYWEKHKTPSCKKGVLPECDKRGEEAEENLHKPA